MPDQGGYRDLCLRLGGLLLPQPALASYENGIHSIGAENSVYPKSTLQSDLVVCSIVEGPVSSFVLFHPKESLKKEEENTAGGVRKRQEKPLTLTAKCQGVNISNAHYKFNNSPKTPRVGAKTTICNCRKLPTSDLLPSR